MSPATVEELKRAWQAVEAGQFGPGVRHDAGVPLAVWVPPPDERMLPVVGAHGSSGASILSLALATVAAPARVLECAPVSRRGLVAAPTAELGDFDGRWTRGSRGDVLIERVTLEFADAAVVPIPSVTDRITRLSVLDVSWDLRQVLATGSWLNCALASPVVVVTTTATIPGFRQLEAVLAAVPAGEVVVAVLGPPRRRWPKLLTRTMGPLTAAADRTHRIVTVPLIPAIHVAGIDPTPLPTPLLSAAEAVLRLTGETFTGKDHP